MKRRWLARCRWLIWRSQSRSISGFDRTNPSLADIDELHHRFLSTVIACVGKGNGVGFGSLLSWKEIEVWTGRHRRRRRRDTSATAGTTIAISDHDAGGTITKKGAGFAPGGLMAA